MPLYHFHIAHNGLDADQQPTECSDNTAARNAAIAFAGQLIKDTPSLVWDGRDFRVEVTNERDDLLFTVIMLSVPAPASRAVVAGAEGP